MHNWIVGAVHCGEHILAVERFIDELVFSGARDIGSPFVKLDMLIGPLIVDLVGLLKTWDVDDEEGVMELGIFVVSVYFRVFANSDIIDGGRVDG